MRFSVQMSAVETCGVEVGWQLMLGVLGNLYTLNGHAKDVLLRLLSFLSRLEQQFVLESRPIYGHIISLNDVNVNLGRVHAVPFVLTSVQFVIVLVLALSEVRSLIFIFAISQFHGLSQHKPLLFVRLLRASLFRRRYSNRLAFVRFHWQRVLKYLWRHYSRWLLNMQANYLRDRWVWLAWQWLLAQFKELEQLSLSRPILLALGAHDAIQILLQLVQVLGLTLRDTKELFSPFEWLFFSKHFHILLNFCIIRLFQSFVHIIAQLTWLWIQFLQLLGCVLQESIDIVILLLKIAILYILVL